MMGCSDWPAVTVDEAEKEVGERGPTTNWAYERPDSHVGTWYLVVSV